MKIWLLFLELFLFSSIAFGESFSLATGPVDGIYTYAPGYFCGRSLSIADGRFTTNEFSDTAPVGQPLRKMKESGRVVIDGARIICLGDNPFVSEIIFHCTVDGVSVLLNQVAMTELHAGLPITSGECLILKDEPELDYYKWWDKLTKAHPGFVKTIGSLLK